MFCKITRVAAQSYRMSHTDYFRSCSDEYVILTINLQIKLLKLTTQHRSQESALAYPHMSDFASDLVAVYTCDFPYESPYDSVYYLLPKMSSKLIFDFFAEMCKQTIVMGDRKRIRSLFCFLTNHARNRMAIHKQIRTRVDSPLDKARVCSLVE
jgi:hypothetical protein